SGWPALPPRFVVLGAGLGFVNAPLASPAVGVVPPRQAGTASGTNNSFRRVGIATGIAALGAIFQAKAGTPHGAFGGRVPPQAVAQFVSGLNEIILVGAGVAAVGAVLSLVLIRPRDVLQQ